jgi:hypothetical protein
VRRLVLVFAIGGIAAFVAAPAATSSWHYTFQNFFDAQGGGIAAGKATAKKCGPGGPQGVYDYRSFVHSSGGETELEVEITGRMSARDKWTKFKQVEVSSQASPNFPPGTEDEIRNALLDFHETVFTRWKGPKHKLQVRHGALVIFGAESVPPGQATIKFKPKPGC